MGKTSTTHLDVVKWDRELEVGSCARVRWTNGSLHHEGEGEVVKLNEKSLRVRLARAVPSLNGGYPAGYEVIVPRPSNWRDWTWQNCAMPAEE
jgi:hypothetical protein